MSNEPKTQVAQLAELRYWHIADHMGVDVGLRRQHETITFLERVRDAAVEIIDESAEYGATYDTVTARADSSVPIRTHQQWELFVDLMLYRDDEAAQLASPETAEFLAAGPGAFLFAAAERGIFAMLAAVGFELDD